MFRPNPYAVEIVIALPLNTWAFRRREGASALHSNYDRSSTARHATPALSTPGLALRCTP